MPARFLVLLWVLLVAVCAAAQAPSSDQLNQPHVEPPPAPARRAEPPAKPVAPLPAVGQDMRADLQRMRALLAQMRSNLAFVQNTQSPLKHQFELDCDMWQILITDLERHMNGPQPEGSPKGAKSPSSH
jgi:hypothetical protein